MTLRELLVALQAISDEHADAGGLPVVLFDSQFAERELKSAEVEVPYTGIGRWVELR